MTFLFFGILLMLFATIFAFVFNKNLKIKIYSFVLFICSIIFIIFTVNPLFIKDQLILQNDFILKNFEINKVGLFFIFVLSIVIFSISLYIPYYVKTHDIAESNLNFHLFSFTILIISIILLFLAKNLLIFLILWELMGISSFFCIFFDGKKGKTINAAIQYNIMMHISFIFIAIATMMSYKITGSFSYEIVRDYFNNNGNIIDSRLKIIIFSLFAIGFFIKLGIFPFHFWLPEAHPASPSHVSSFMSSIVIKTGLYGLILILGIFGVQNLNLSIFIIFIGLLSASIGIINAASQKEIKKFLAYSSIENAGLLLFFYGSILFAYVNKDYFLVTSAFLAIFVYLLNHALSKSSAFLSAGIIINETEISSLDSLGGLVHFSKSVSSANFLSSISLSALPPFGNFIGELLIIIAYSNYIINVSFSLVPFAVFLLIGLIGAITILSFVKYFSIGFLGNFRAEATNKKWDIGILTSISIYITLILAVILSSPYFYKIYFNLFKDYSPFLISIEIQDFMNESMEKIVSNSFNFYSLVILFLLSIAVFSFIYNRLKIKKSKTWACGFIEKQQDNFQYSSTSFVQSFINIFKPLTGIKKKEKKKEELFAKTKYFETEHYDIIHKNFLTPIIEKIDKFFERFTFIQSGRTQDYIIYGLLFLVLIIIVTLLRHL